jgi:hypothetical protein
MLLLWLLSGVDLPPLVHTDQCLPTTMAGGIIEMSGGRMMPMTTANNLLPEARGETTTVATAENDWIISMVPAEEERIMVGEAEAGITVLQAETGENQVENTIGRIATIMIEGLIEMTAEAKGIRLMIKGETIKRREKRKIGKMIWAIHRSV